MYTGMLPVTLKFSRVGVVALQSVLLVNCVSDSLTGVSTFGWIHFLKVDECWLFSIMLLLASGIVMKPLHYQVGPTLTCNWMASQTHTNVDLSH